MEVARFKVLDDLALPHRFSHNHLSRDENELVKLSQEQSEHGAIAKDFLNVLSTEWDKTIEEAGARFYKAGAGTDEAGREARAEKEGAKSNIPWKWVMSSAALASLAAVLITFAVMQHNEKHAPALPPSPDTQPA